MSIRQTFPDVIIHPDGRVQLVTRDAQSWAWNWSNLRLNEWCTVDNIPRMLASVVRVEERGDVAAGVSLPSGRLIVLPLYDGGHVVGEPMSYELLPRRRGFALDEIHHLGAGSCFHRQDLSSGVPSQ